MFRRSRPTTRRTRIVWAVFAAAMTLVTGLLILGDGARPGGIVAAGIASSTFTRSSDNPIEPTQASLDTARWTSIVIHHSGSPVGDPDSLTREHLSYGYASLGYHFIVGNGHGLGEGAVFVGPRWNQQQPGAHVAGPLSSTLNQHAIGICLIGNGERRPFSDRQMRELVSLVRRLQQALDIPASAVRLHSDVAAVGSPGRFFPVGEFESQLLR